MTNPQMSAQNRAPDQAPRFLDAGLASLVARFRTIVKRLREAQRSRAQLDSFNDRMLADIGLRRSFMAPEIEDLRPTLDADRARFSRF